MLAPGGVNLGGMGTWYLLYLLLFLKYLAVISVKSQRAAALWMRALCGGKISGNTGSARRQARTLDKSMRLWSK